MQDHQLLRYSRHILLPNFDVAGQRALLNAKVLVMGAGGLGSASIQYLAAAGIGELFIADFDVVDETNLQRQVIHSLAKVGQLKTESAKAWISQNNPDVKVTCINEKMDAQALTQWIEKADLVLDGTDNFASRFLTNQVCVATGTPLVSGAAIGFEGQVTVFIPGDDDSPCYRCLYQDDQPQEMRCAENGVIGPIVGMIGTTQAMEAIKVLAKVGRPLKGRLLILDALTMDWRTMKFKRNAQCSVCGHPEA